MPTLDLSPSRQTAQAGPARSAPRGSEGPRGAQRGPTGDASLRAVSLRPPFGGRRMSRRGAGHAAPPGVDSRWRRRCSVAPGAELEPPPGGIPAVCAGCSGAGGDTGTPQIADVDPPAVYSRAGKKWGAADSLSYSEDTARRPLERACALSPPGTETARPGARLAAPEAFDKYTYICNERSFVQHVCCMVCSEWVVLAVRGAPARAVPLATPAVVHTVCTTLAPPRFSYFFCFCSVFSCVSQAVLARAPSVPAGTSHRGAPAASSGSSELRQQ